MKKKLNIFIPLGITILSIILIIIQGIFFKLTSRYLTAIVGGTLLCWIYPILFMMIKKNMPIFPTIIIAFQSILACFIGTAYDLYTIFPYYDVVVHGLFGVEAGAFAFYFLILGKGQGVNLFGFLSFLMFFAMGCAALWEIVEFITDFICHTDCQHVFDGPDGANPILDTITDMMITFVGVLVSYLIVWFDKYKNYRFMKWLYHDIHSKDDFIKSIN